MKPVIFESIIGIFLTFAVADFSSACTCTMTYAVPANAGEVTITKVRTSSVEIAIPGEIAITLPYSTRWKGSRKIKPGKRYTFSFGVTSNCENGKRQFAVTRKDGKSCYKSYAWPRPYDLCGLNSSNRKRTAPVVSCAPDEWTTESPR